MKIKQLTLVLVAGALASFFAAIGYEVHPKAKPEPTLQQALFVQPNPLQVHLYPARDDPQPTDLVRSSDFVGEDGRVKDSYVTYYDRSTEDIHYFLDGVHKASSEDYFAAVDGARGRLLRGISLFEPDGETYKFHKVYRNPSGYLERLGQRLRDGRYEQEYFFEDGANVARVRYFDSALSFSTEEVRRWNTAHNAVFVYARILRADFAGQFWVSVYREDGTLSAVLKHSDGQDEGRLYDRDGVTLLAEFGSELAGYHTYFLGYTKGSELPTMEWNSLMGRTTVTEVDPQTNLVTLQQVWKERPDPSVPGGKRYLLMTASRYDPFQQTILKVEMSDSGSKPTAVTVSGRDGRVMRTVDASRLTRESSADRKEIRPAAVAGSSAQAKPESTDALDDVEEQYVEIPRGLLKLPQRPQLVKFDDFGPPRIYDYR